MRRKVSFAVILVATALSLLLLFTWFSQISLRERWATTPQNSDLGSTYIFKGLQAEDKVVVIAKMEAENVDWVVDELHDWQHAIYHMDDPTWVLHPPVNKGREAMAYLTFIISHYSALPEVIVFLHPHLRGWPEAWHTDAEGYDNVNSIRNLRLDYVRENGYANMRCIYVPGCPAEIQPFRNDSERQHELAFADAYTYMLGGNLSTVPHVIGTPCCAQFAVSAAQVRRRPRSDYLRYRQWLIDTELDSNVSGRVMEYMWHIIFGQEPIWCPELKQCWCQQFGRCG